MRGKFSAGVLMALAFLIPAAPAMAQDAPTGLNADCKTVERTVYKDFRALITIDLDTATDIQVRVQADQILSEAKAESLPTLSTASQARLDGTPEDLRAFLKTGVRQAWITDLRITVNRVLDGAGENVAKTAQKTLDASDIESYLTFLNDGQYTARALDCASKSPEPPVKPTVTKTATPAATSSSSAAAGGSGGEGGGGLPLTGTNTGIVAVIGSILLLLGGTGYLLGRRRRSRFVA
jgi:LPXTG-motif cell wall-anchored protein